LGLPRQAFGGRREPIFGDLSRGHHRAPFALELLDQATTRRFLFKVRFPPMTNVQIAAAFHGAFGAEAPDSALKLSGLTPGDFAIAARKGVVIGERDPRLLAKWLEDEVPAKPGAGRRRIGF
jgi:hypothetical protein